jgi:hypothetical protein
VFEQSSFLKRTKKLLILLCLKIQGFLQFGKYLEIEITKDQKRFDIVSFWIKVNRILIKARKTLISIY